MLQKLILVLVLSLLAVSTDPINEDLYEWKELSSEQMTLATQKSQLFQMVNSQATSFWLIYQKQSLQIIQKIQQLFLNKVHYFRITYKSTAGKLYDQVVISVRVDFAEKRKVMVTRSLPPISIADNMDGYISDY